MAFSTKSAVSINLAASRSNAWSNGWGTTFWNSELAAGLKLNVDSGRDFTLNGAKATGETVFARIGSAGAGNLTIASPQDESFYKAREQSYGVNVSVPFGTQLPSLGLSASSLRLLAENESIKQQSALSAAGGGYDILVNGHTHLVGSAITSKASTASNRLETQTLTHQDVQNRDVVSGKSWSVSLTLSATPPEPGSTTPGPWGVAGSSVGFARLDTNETFTTRSSVAGITKVTRPDLQASRAAALKAAEREPLVSERSSKQAQLDQLLWNEPPKCIGCQLLKTEDAEAPAASASPSAGPLTLPKPEIEALATSPQWLAWQSAVASLRAQIATLSGRIQAVDAKVYQTVDTLNTVPSGLHLPLLHTFDKNKATQTLKDGVAVTAAFGKAAYKTAGDYAGAKEREARLACANAIKCPEADRWSDGGLYRTALHMAIGGMAFGTAGAVGNGAGAAALNAMDKVLKDLNITDPSAVNLLKNLVVTAAGLAAGGTTGAAAAFNADANNRQLHPDESRYLKAKIAAWAAKRGISDLAQAEQELTRGALYDNDLKWNSALRNWTPSELASYKLAADYLRAEANKDGFKFTNLDGVLQAGFTSTPAQYQNSQYFLNLALSDPLTRRLYVDRAAISLSFMDKLQFSAATLQPAGKGLVAGVEEQLLAYKSLLDPATYVKLVAAVRVMREQGFTATLNKVFDGVMAGGQAAAYGTWLSWMQADSAALGHGAGRIAGAAVVDTLAAAAGIALLKNTGRVVEGVTDVQAAAVRRIEDAAQTQGNNKKIVDTLLQNEPRVMNGVPLSPKLTVDPAAGWTYTPDMIPNAKGSENLYWSHHVGHQAEVRLASELADQGQMVVRWGDKIGTNGADVISVNPSTGQVSLWDTKFLSADKSIKMAGAFDFTGSTGPGKLAGLMKQAEDAIVAARLQPAIEAKAIAEIRAQNFFANTVGAGNARNSVPKRFCGSNPC